MKWLRNYKYKGLTLILISIILTIFLSENNSLNKAIFSIAQIPILGAFIAGILYVSASTAAFGVFILLGLSKTLSPIEIAIVAGLGGAVADFILFRFFRDDIIGEITPIYNRLGGKHLAKIMHHKYLSWSLPIIGAIIIASPFPDEIGISLMGISKIKSYQFAILSLILDIAGVFILISAFKLLK